MLLTPVALFTYNRPEHTRRVLSSLEQCSQLEACRIYIFCDAARTPAHQSAVEASRSVVRDFAPRIGAQVIERDKNLGLARSIVEGVTSLIREYGRIIVLEDDLILSPDFLDYMLQGLDRFQDNKQVYQISGYIFPISPTPLKDTFFLPLITTWGWATWERAWQVFDWNPPQALERIADEQTRKRFDLDDSYPYADMLKQRLAGQNDSWGILWWYAVFNADGLVLYPKKSLVRNEGFDGTGTHSGGNRAFAQSIYTDVSRGHRPVPLNFPSSIEVDPVIWANVKAFLRNQQKQVQGID